MIHHSARATEILKRIRKEAGFPDFLMPQEIDFLKASAGFQYVMTHAGTTRHECVELGVQLAEIAQRLQHSHVFSFDFRKGEVVIGKFYVVMPSEDVLCSVLEHEYLHFRAQRMPRRKWILPVDCLNQNINPDTNKVV
jgi:hypothetical protein